MSATECIVYGLIDPRDGALRYVGRTTQRLHDRARQHRNVADHGKDKSRKCQWMRELHAQSLREVMVEIERVPREGAEEHEKFWADYFVSIGADLLNEIAPNAGGTRSYVVGWTAELDARLGTIPDEEYAKELGVDRKDVGYRRRFLGIPKCGNRYYVQPIKVGGWNKIKLPESVLARLGAQPDYILARELGIDKGVIARARRGAKIPPYAEVTGNDGRYKSGALHRRWHK